MLSQMTIKMFGGLKSQWLPASKYENFDLLISSWDDGVMPNILGQTFENGVEGPVFDKFGNLVLNSDTKMQ